MGKIYSIQAPNGKIYDIQAPDQQSPIQPALDMAGTAIGVGGQAVRGADKLMETINPNYPAMKQGAGLLNKYVAQPVAKGYNYLKDLYLDSPANPYPKLLDKEKTLNANIPIKELHGGKLEQTGNIPISESPSSIMKHIQSLGIDFALGAGAQGKAAEFNEPSAMLTRASKAHDKARNLVAEILQPKTGNMSEAIESSLPEIKPVKDYGQLHDLLDSSRANLASNRNYELAKSGKKVGEEYLKPLNELYSVMIKDPQLADKAEPIAKALHNEYKYLFSKPDRKISVMEAESRKENLQKLTEPLLNSGGADISDPALKQAWDKIRYGFRRSIEDVVPEVKKYNEPYGGMKEATELAANQRDLALKEGPHNPFKNLIAHVFRGSKAQTGAALVREAFRKESSLYGNTKKASQLYKKATSLRELASRRLP